MGRRSFVTGKYMYLNNNSFAKKRRFLVLVGALIVGFAVPAVGVMAFEGMLKIGQSDNPIAASNEPAP